MRHAPTSTYYTRSLGITAQQAARWWSGRATRARQARPLHQLASVIEVWLPTGTREVTFSFSYSRTTPRLEVVQAVRGTPWEPVPGSGIHHLGFWSDDFDGDAADLERRGYVREAAAVAPDGRPMFAFYRGATGPRIELVPTGSRPFLEQLWS